MEQVHYIKDSLNIKDLNITVEKEFDKYPTHWEYHGKLDYNAPQRPACQGQMSKYDFQRPCTIPYLETVGYKVVIRLKKRRFKCKSCGEMTVGVWLRHL